MARGDVISVAHVALSQNSDIDIQPSSGDEWLITTIWESINGTPLIRGFDGSNTCSLTNAPHGGNTVTTDNPRLAVSGEIQKLFLLNGEYIRIHENNSANNELAYWGVKTKD